VGHLKGDKHSFNTDGKENKEIRKADVKGKSNSREGIASIKTLK
jgi:hypothetical protein